MKMKKLSALLLAVLILSTTLLSFNLRGGISPTVLCVDPQTTTVGPGDTFTINVNITSVTNLTGYEFKLYWNRTLLNVTAAVDTPPPQWANPFSLGPGLEPNYNATHGRYFRGYVNLYCGGATGNFILASLTFNATAIGDCTLALRDTRIAGRDCQPIPHTAQDGHVHVTTAPPCMYPVSWQWGNYTDPDNERPFNLTAIVTISDCCLAVQNFNFNRSLGQISFDITSATPGSCNVTVPKLLMDGAFKVLINDTLVASILTWNKTHTFVYFTYPQGTHNVKIIGEIVTRVRGPDLLTMADVNGDGEVDIMDILMGQALVFGWKEEWTGPS